MVAASPNRVNTPWRSLPHSLLWSWCGRRGWGSRGGGGGGHHHTTTHRDVGGWGGRGPLRDHRVARGDPRGRQGRGGGGAGEEEGEPMRAGNSGMSLRRPCGGWVLVGW